MKYALIAVLAAGAGAFIGTFIGAALIHLGARIVLRGEAKP